MLAGLAPPPLLGAKGSVFSAYAVETAPVIWTSTAGVGGPLLYNGSSSGHGGVTAYILAVSFGLSTASAAAGAVGLAIGTTTAPTSTSAITSSGPLWVGNAPSLCTAYSIGTVSVAATNFLPIGQVGTSALTAEIADDNFIHLGGAIVLPPGAFCSFAASATLTTAVLSCGLVWLEMPND
jgi:hypothetical protein